MHNFKLILNITKSFKQYKKVFISLMILMIIMSFLESLGIMMLLPVIQNILNNNLPEGLSFLYEITNNSNQLILFLLVFMFIIVIIKLLIRIQVGRESSKLTWEIKNKWSNEIYKLILTGSYEYFTSKKQGELVNIISTQPQLACNTLGKIIQFYSSIIMLLGYLIFMLIVDIKVTLIVSVCVLFYFFVLSILTTLKASKYSLKRSQLYKAINELIIETISMVKQVKIFSMEKKLVNEFNSINSSLKKEEVKFSVINILSTNINEIIILSIVLLVFSLNSIVDIMNFKEVFPTIVIFGLMGIKIMAHSSALISIQMSIIANTESLKSINTFLDELRLHDKKKLINGDVIDTLKNNILIDNLSFQYEQGSKEIKYGSFEIKRGKYTAIIGESGCGKSTFIDILLKFYKPTNGEILINDIALENIDEYSWRNKIGYVTQEPELFNDTILNNIKISKSSVSFEEIEKVAKQCHIHEFIMSLEKGYSTTIGDRGVMLSGGQKQRLAIARALIREPDIIIFDEATSALDDKTENIIKETLDEIKQNKTIIAIAHRKTTIENADYLLDFNKLVTTIENKNKKSIESDAGLVL